MPEIVFAWMIGVACGVLLSYLARRALRRALRGEDSDGMRRHLQEKEQRGR